MSTWLLTGADGMLGRDLVNVLSENRDIKLVASTRADLDITDADAVRAAVAGCEMVINAAAWTDVDGAESHEAAAAAVNARGAGNVAAACARAGAMLIHISTDYVVAGDASTPYPEDAPVSPVNAYGRTKADGEAAVQDALAGRGFVVRTAWLYGEYGKNFITTILRAAGHQAHLDVVDDAIGQPTWSCALAGQLLELGLAATGGRATPGVYHGTASGSTSWYGLARAAFQALGLDPARVRPVSSQRFPRPARRPAFSVLGHAGWARAGMRPLPGWRPMLELALRRPAFAELGRAAR